MFRRRTTYRVSETPSLRAEDLNEIQDSIVQIGWFLAGALAIGFFIGVLFAGCAAPLVVAKPLERVARPCVTTLPTAVALKAVTEPEKAAYLDGEGRAKTAMSLVFDLDVLSAYFSYVGSLEEIAKKSLGCVERPPTVNVRR